MNAMTGISRKAGFLTGAAMLAMFAFAPYTHASPVRINFSTQISSSRAGGGAGGP